MVSFNKGWFDSGWGWAFFLCCVDLSRASAYFEWIRFESVQDQ
jgi:hypothetical protein